MDILTGKICRQLNLACYYYFSRVHENLLQHPSNNISIISQAVYCVKPCGRGAEKKDLILYAPVEIPYYTPLFKILENW